MSANNPDFPANIQVERQMTRIPEKNEGEVFKKKVLDDEVEKGNQEDQSTFSRYVSKYGNKFFSSLIANTTINIRNVNVDYLIDNSPKLLQEAEKVTKDPRALKEANWVILRLSARKTYADVAVLSELKEAGQLDKLKSFLDTSQITIEKVKGTKNVMVARDKNDGSLL